MWSFWKSMPDAPKVVSRTKNKTPKKSRKKKKTTSLSLYNCLTPWWTKQTWHCFSLRFCCFGLRLQVLTLFLEACLASWNLDSMVIPSSDFPWFSVAFCEKIIGWFDETPGKCWILNMRFDSWTRSPSMSFSHLRTGVEKSLDDQMTFVVLKLHLL